MADDDQFVLVSKSMLTQLSGAVKRTCAAAGVPWDVPEFPTGVAFSTDVGAFLMDVGSEVARARVLHPSNEALGVAMGEEFGELCKASLDEASTKVYWEGVQAAAMAARFVLDGDPGVQAVRKRKGLDDMTTDPTKET